MRIEIITKNYTMSDWMKNLIEEKLSKFDKYFDDDAVAKVALKTIGKEGSKNFKYGMEVTIFFGSNMVRSEVSADEMQKNIDIALPKIEGQIRKYRTKLDKLKRGAFDESTLYASTLGDKEKQLVRTKTIHLNSITTAQAIEKMELADHDFYVYMDADSGMVSLVYCREDGEVGRIELVY